MQSELEAVELLTNRLTSTPRQSLKESRALREKHRKRIFDAMTNDGKTYGEAIGGLEFLGKQDTPAYLKSIQNDLGRQVEICNEVLDQYFQMGEPMYPGYFFRVAVILRKHKAFEHEKEFIRAYALHSYGADNTTEKKMSARADKLGVAPVNPPQFLKAGSAI